jgi:hypothetical protein
VAVPTNRSLACKHRPRHSRRANLSRRISNNGR